MINYKIPMMIAACAGLLVGGIGVSYSETIKVNKYPVNKTITYSFTVQNTTGQPLEQAEFWTYAPVKQTGSQKVNSLVVSAPYEMINDKLGNQVLHFKFDTLAPYAVKIITIRADLLLTDTPNIENINSKDSFLAAEKYVEIDNPKLIEVAESVIGKTQLETAKNSFNWTASNVQSEMYIPDDRGALYALETRKGDCTEFMYLFAALSRINNIPARGMGGYVYSDNATLKAQDYHNWAEFYEDGRWRISDPQKRIFNEKSSQFIAMRIISSSADNVLGNAHRFHYAGEGLKVVMN